MKKGMNSHFLRRKAVQQGWRARGGSGLRRTGILQGPSPGSPHVLQSRSELSRVQPDRALLRRAPQPGPESPALWQRPLAQQTLPPCPHSGHEAPPGALWGQWLLPTNFRKRKRKTSEEKSVGARLFPPDPAAPSGCQPPFVPAPTPAVGAAGAPRAGGGGQGAGALRPPHLLATADSWSRMRPSPSSIVSSVSLLSSTVTADTEGLSPHRLGSSRI